ncbi:flagellar biosynthesis protein FlhA [Scatolibacter rhodanostii]|uniref:flagellar biosynthesis protein FlhA n=1 Tax=Scatolibacter rhodanostii TaxID=2014781 RepID=UPI000C07C097|nr:flagellar biosynthesis protein FlhA [Scatolibacter rhodanostii]
MNVKFLNNVVSVFVVLVIAFLIIPLGTGMLDFLLILNLALSLVILLITMYIKEPLEFSIYPSLLLITTLFRLVLNVSSTRAILSNSGYAGEVIKTFGQFVIGGNIVVGLVVFIIIVLVQFLVITKGSERVAEVSARFTLDAMPGKQMAIDADLNSGLIDENQARERRSKIQREADFFGSMDGASKFVKGDSIISIIVTLVNLIGGIGVGFLGGQGDIQTIINTYAIATVGNGLMSQIPALLISVATGMVVTRSASEANLNTDVIQQFMGQPTALMIAGAGLPFLAFIGFPPLQLFLMSAVLFALGFILLRRNRAALQTVEEGPAVIEEVTSEVNYYKNLNNVYDLLNVDPISVQVGYSLLPLVDEGSGGNFLDRVVMLRKQFADNMGMVIPSLRLSDSSELNPNQYQINLRGEALAVGEVLVDHYMGLAPNDILESDEIDGIETVDPAFGMPAKWISDDKRIKAEMAGYTLIDPTSVIITHLSEIVRVHAYELLTRQEVKRMVENLKKTNEDVVNDTIPSVISLNDLQRVLRGLLKEGIPIIDLEIILETLSDYSPTVKDNDMLIEYVRQALKRTITHRYSEAGQLKVLSLDSNIEDVIIKGLKKIEGGTYLNLPPDMIQKIMQRTKEEVDKVGKLVQTPIILTSPVVRIYFKRLLDQFYPNITVLSINDVDTNVQILALGNIGI